MPHIIAISCHISLLYHVSFGGHDMAMMGHGCWFLLHFWVNHRASPHLRGCGVRPKELIASRKVGQMVGYSPRTLVWENIWKIYGK